MRSLYRIGVGFLGLALVLLLAPSCGRETTQQATGCSGLADLSAAIQQAPMNGEIVWFEYRTTDPVGPWEIRNKLMSENEFEYFENGKLVARYADGIRAEDGVSEPIPPNFSTDFLEIAGIRDLETLCAEDSTVSISISRQDGVVVGAEIAKNGVVGSRYRIKTNGSST